MDESEIKYMIKPEWVSWDDVQKCQAISHKKNIEKGLKMHCSELTGEELKQQLKDGICFIALDGKKVVGTTSLIIQDVKKLGIKKRLGYLCMEGILPEYQGTDVYFGLQEIRFKTIKDSNVDIVYFDTAENNTVVRKLSEKGGYKNIYYISFRSTDYYSVTMAKWLKGKPIPDFILKPFFFLSEKYVKLRFKPHRIKRFGI